MGIPRRSTRCALVLPVIAVIAACGTTVPQATVLSATGGGATVAQGGATTTQSGVPAGGVADPGATTGPAAAGPGAVASATGSGPGTVSSPVAGTTALPVAGKSAAPGQITHTTTGVTAKASASAKPGATKSAGASASKAPTSGSSSAAAASTAPIKIGFDYFSAASSQATDAAAGVSNATTLTPDGIFMAYVTYVNAHGGLGGRQIVPELHSENDMSNSFASDATAACTVFTQDTPVPIVVDAAWGAGYGFNTCLTRAGVEDVSLPQAPDAASLSANPFQVNPIALTPDRAYSDALIDLVKAGTLKSGAKVGVFMDKCSSTTAAYTNTIAPTFKRLGLIPDVFATSCIGGYDGLAGASTDTSSAILQFRGNGDTQVMVISAEDPTYWELYGVNAASQKYSTGFIMTSYSEVTALEGNFTADQKASVHGVGWIPVLDTDSPKLPGDAAETSCDAMAAAQGQNPTSNDDQYSLYTICAPVLLLKAAFAADGANGTAAVLSKAFTGLGTSFSAPSINGGQTDFSHQDGVADVQVFGYQTSCSCLQYSGSQTAA